MDTLKDKLSKAAKPAVDYGKNLYQQTKALLAPLDNEAAAVKAKQGNIDEYKKVNPSPAPSKDQKASPGSYKKGGKVKRSGMAKVHKGERVLTTNQAKKMAQKGGFSKLFGASK